MLLAIFLEGRLAAPATAPSPAALTAEVLQSRAGLYRHPQTMDVIRLEVVDGVLKADGQSALVPVDDRVFAFGPDPSARIEFELGPRGAVIASKWTFADGPERYLRVEPAVLTPERRAAYVGTYVAPEAEATVSIAVDGETLVASNGPDSKGTMVAADADVFTVADVGTFAFDRDRRGKVTGFRFFSGRLRGLRFERRG